MCITVGRVDSVPMASILRPIWRKRARCSRAKDLMNSTLISNANAWLPRRAGRIRQFGGARSLAASRGDRQPTFEAALEAVRSGDTDLAIIPVENSVYGRIADVHFLVRYFGRAIKGHIAEGPRHLFILGEHFHRVRHQLLGLKGARMTDVKTVYSQAPALGQCRKIMKELGLVEKQWSDTAGAAHHLAELKDPSAAAIASAWLANLWPRRAARRCRR